MKKLPLLALCSSISACSPQQSVVYADVFPESDLLNITDRIYFSVNSSDIDVDSRQRLNRQIAWLKENPKTKLVIEGHSDERGTREYNIALGERRAAADKAYLIENGIDAARITIVSYGKERPAVIGHDETAWRQNRRATTIVDKPY